MPATTWKPTCASAWDGLCCAACVDVLMAAVVLVDSGALGLCNAPSVFQ